MNYNDSISPAKGFVRTKYSNLEETTNYDCDQYCLCRNTGERSVKDKMYYDWFVLNKPVVMPPESKNQMLQNPQYKKANQK